MQIENHIDGRARPAHSGRTTTIFDPADGAAIGEMALSGAADVDDAVRAAVRAFERWSRTPPAQRSLALLRLADLIDEHGGELVDLEVQDVGKPISAMREEIPFISDNLRLFAAAARTLHVPAPDRYAPGTFSLLRREPLGVIGQVSAWNYPLMMAIWKIGPALAAGNAVVLKPSEETPLSTARLAELAHDVLPSGALNVVFGEGAAVGAPLVAHPDVRMVSVTGHVDTGRSVARTAADAPKPTHLELGGKAPALVFADADLAAVAAGVRAAGFANAGQDCTALTRVLVQQSVADELLELLGPEVRSLRVGDPRRPETEVGPLASSAQHARVSAALRSIPSDAWRAAPTVSTTRGHFVEPTIVAGVDQRHPLVQREIFGPVVTVQSFRDEPEGVRMANDVPYGLVASVWTRTADRAMRVACALDYGTVWVNGHQTLVSEMPHGGRKASGNGSDMSVNAVDENTQPKHIMLAMGGDAGA